MKTCFVFLLGSLLCFGIRAEEGVYAYNVGTNVCCAVALFPMGGVYCQNPPCYTDPGPGVAANATFEPGQGGMVIYGGACGQPLVGQHIKLYMRWGPCSSLTNGPIFLYDYDTPSPCGTSNIDMNVPMAANGQLTNCTDTVTISNPDTEPHTYQLYHHYQSAGSVTIPGGSTWSMKVPNPGCSPYEWYSQIVPNYIDLGPPNVYNPNNNPTAPGNDTPVIPINGTPSNSGAGNNQPANGGGNGNNGPYPIAPYTNNAANGPTNANTNGPIQYGPSGGSGNPTNGANNGVVEASANALYTAVVQQGQSIVQAIQTLDLHNQQGQAGISNDINGLSNGIAQINTNLSNLTGMWSTNVDLSAERSNGILANADAQSAGGQTALQGFGDSLAGLSAPSIPSPGDYSITIGSGRLETTVDIDPLSSTNLFPQVAGVAPWIRSLSEWAMWFWFILWLVGEINALVRQASIAPQAVTSEVIPGAAEAEGVVFAGIIVGALEVLITVAGGYLTSTMVSTFLNHPFSGGGTQAVQSGVAWLDAVFDISLCLNLAAQRVSLPFYMTKVYFRCVAVIRFVS